MACSPEGKNDRRVNQFEKFTTLNGIADRLAARYLGPDAPGKMDGACGRIPEGGYDEIVDPAGVHKSLAGYSNIAEARFAWAVTEILKGRHAELSALEEDLYAEGRKDAYADAADAGDAFRWLMLHYLDGMPCDDTLEVTERTETCVTWRKLEDTHEAHWRRCGGGVDVYYRLFVRYADGLLSGTGFHVKTSDGTLFVLKK